MTVKESLSELENTQTYTYSIRPATQADASALSEICLLTADAGKDGQTHHAYRELPGLYYSVPYVHLSGAGGFVLVRCADMRKAAGKEEETVEEVIGYSLYALDTLDFRARMEKEWLLSLRVKYPLPDDSDSNNATTSSYEVPLNEADLVYVKRIHKPDPLDSACLAFCPAHMHINILPSAQKQGWGRRLVSAVVAKLESENHTRVFLGYDPRNVNAAEFYAHLGFKHVKGGQETSVGLEFKEFRRP